MTKHRDHLVGLKMLRPLKGDKEEWSHIMPTKLLIKWLISCQMILNLEEVETVVIALIMFVFLEVMLIWVLGDGAKHISKDMIANDMNSSRLFVVEL